MDFQPTDHRTEFAKLPPAVPDQLREASIEMLEIPKYFEFALLISDSHDGPT